MKKLLKSGICGSVNSAQVHCSPWKSQQMQAEEKGNKKKGENAKETKRGRDKLDPNLHLVSLQPPSRLASGPWMLIILIK